MVANGSAEIPSQNSHLFTVRVWLEDLGDGQTDWRGKVQHVNSGEVRYFRNWPTMERFMEGLVHKARDPEIPSAEIDKG